jgi:Tfp pilus assembly protein FimV
MKIITNALTAKRYLQITLLGALLFFYLTTLNAETVPSFPAPTMVEKKPRPTQINPFPTSRNIDQINDPQALNAIRTLIQGGIPVGQSKTQITDSVKPIKQYSGDNMSNKNTGLSDNYRYIVKRGDTLNKIIKATFNQHPLKMRQIRRAIIANNRKAFPTGKPTSMQAGATLLIPSVYAIQTSGNAISAGSASKQQIMDPQDNPCV